MQRLFDFANHTFSNISIMANTKTKVLLLGLMVAFSCNTMAESKLWTLHECIQYAMEHNIQLRQNNLQKASAGEDTKQARAQLLPSLAFQTSQSISHRPFPESGMKSVTNGFVDIKIDKTSYSGNYGINANWTVWNGNRNHNTIRMGELAEQQAQLTAEQTANTIQEQIAQLYVQILYSKEGIHVYEQVVEISKQNVARGEQMLELGTIAKADLAQLKAQMANDEFNLVNAKGQLARYKLQLKQLLELTDGDEFDIVEPNASDQQALELIPSLSDTYDTALMQRPEIKNAQIGIKSGETQLKIAKAGLLPTISMNGSIGSTTMSTSDNAWERQLKSNLNSGVGLSLMMPLFDQRSTKTNVNKARMQIEQQKLTLQNEQKKLWSTIEGYWLDANTNQQRFRSAQTNVASAEESYTLLSEQFNEGLKNIQELTTGKQTLLNAQQMLLESKYSTILGIQLLKFYQGMDINL